MSTSDVYVALLQSNPEKYKKLLVDDTGRLITTASGTFAPGGLTIGGKVTEVTLNSATWTALPATALTDRNHISIQNPSTSEIKLNYDNSIGTYTGVILGAGNERHYDITDSITIYAKSQSGTPTIIVEEVA